MGSSFFVLSTLRNSKLKIKYMPLKVKSFLSKICTERTFKGCSAPQSPLPVSLDTLGKMQDLLTKALGRSESA